MYIDNQRIPSQITQLDDDEYIVNVGNDAGIFKEYTFDDIASNIIKINLKQLPSYFPFESDLQLILRKITSRGPEKREKVVIYIRMINLHTEFQDLFNKYREAMSIYRDENPVDNIVTFAPDVPGIDTKDRFVMGAYPEYHTGISEQIRRIRDLFTEMFLHARSIYGVNAFEGSESINLVFNFPRQVATACEQYLLYFTEFLRELGVDAGTNITHDAGKTLFSVVPADAEQALHKIREALDIYLQLPVVYEQSTSIVPMTDIPTQQLIAQVQHLSSQLMLGAALLQTKDATLQAHQAALQAQAITIATLHRAFNGEIIINSIQNAPDVPKVTDEEPVLGGALILGRAGPEGVQVNLGEIYRKLRSWFSGG